MIKFLFKDSKICNFFKLKFSLSAKFHISSVNEAINHANMLFKVE